MARLNEEEEDSALEVMAKWAALPIVLVDLAVQLPSSEGASYLTSPAFMIGAAMMIPGVFSNTYKTFKNITRGKNEYGK